MKVLQIISSFPPAYAYGGPARMAYHISRELVKKGHEITVFTTDVYDAHSRLKYNKNPMNMEGIEVYHFKNLSNMLAKNNLPLAPTMAFALKACIKGFDIVHLHEYRSFQAIFGRYYAKKYGIPYVLQAYGSVPQVIEKIRLKKLFDALYGLKILNGARKLIALTKMDAEQYMKLGVNRAKIEIIPNATDLSEYVKLPKKGEFRKKHRLNEEKIVLYLGRLHRIKGLDLLIKAFTGLLKDVENCKLVIVGPDEGYLPTAKSLVMGFKINDKVLFIGPLDDKDKLESYVDADVYVLPSIYDAFPLAVLEACACGTPVIVTDRCGMADLINNKGGIVVQRDEEKMRNALIRVLTNEELREKFGTNGKKLVREQFTYPKIVKRIEDVYKGVFFGGNS